MTAQASTTLRPISAHDLAAAKLPEVSPDIIAEGQIAVIAAQYGRGKTPLLAHIALQAATGSPLTPLGLSNPTKKVLVFDGESTPSLYRLIVGRIALASGVQLPEDLRIWFKLGESITSGECSPEAIRRLVAHTKPGLVVFDPLRIFALGYELTKPNEALRFMEWLRSLQKDSRGLRIVLSHHLVKRDLRGELVGLSDDPWAWLERISGSMPLLDHADVRLGFEEDEGKRVLAGIKRGVGVVGPWYFEIEEDAEGEPLRFRFEECNNTLKERHAEYFKNLPEEFSWKEARVTLGIGDSTLHRFIKDALRVGRLSKSKSRTYLKVEVRK